MKGKSPWRGQIDLFHYLNRWMKWSEIFKVQHNDLAFFFLQPYVYTPSRKQLGAAMGVKRGSLMVLIREHEDYQKIFNKCKEEMEALPIAKLWIYLIKSPTLESTWVVWDRWAFKVLASNEGMIWIMDLF